MAEIDYYLKQAGWVVTNNGGPLLGPILPKKGTIIKIEREGKVCHLVALEPGGKRVYLKGFRFQGGRLEHVKLDPNYMLIIEEAKSNGKPRLKARIEPRGTKKAAETVKPLPKRDMTGTWGAEGCPGGGGGGGTKKVAVKPQPQKDMTATWSAEGSAGGGVKKGIKSKS